MEVYKNPNLQYELEELQKTLQTCLQSLHSATYNEIKLNNLEKFQLQALKDLQIAKLIEKHSKDRISSLKYSKDIIYGIVKSDKLLL